MKIFQIWVAVALSTCMLPGSAVGSHLQQDANAAPKRQPNKHRRLRLPRLRRRRLRGYAFPSAT